jgi:hypothetical protein
MAVSRTFFDCHNRRRVPKIAKIENFTLERIAFQALSESRWRGLEKIRLNVSVPSIL